MLLKRVLTTIVAVASVSCGLTAVSATPALAASCYYPGGGGYGADLTGWLPDDGIGPVPTLQPIVYDLIGFSDLPTGCTAGELDLVAYTTEGTPGTCTLVLPHPAIPGTGCANLLGDGGAGVTTERPYGFRLTVEAELIAVGADGTKLTRTGSCSGYLDEFYFSSFRCAL